MRKVKKKTKKNVKTKKTFSLTDIKWLGESLALYKPLAESQRLFHRSLADVKWIFGGNQSSKTYTNMADLSLLALNVHPVRTIKGPSVHWACIESWEQCRDILWTEYLEKFIPAWQISDIRYGPDRVPRKLFLKNDNLVEFKAFNQGRNLFQGRGIDSIHCDEQCHHDFIGILQEIETRLLKRNGFLSWSMTPIMPQPDLEERIEALPNTDEVFYADLNDNRISRGGYIPDERIDRMIDEWPVEVQATRIKGRFASFYGAVYRTFSRDVHMIKPFKIPSEWRKYRGFDFGFTNPFASLWMAQDKDENWYVYREYYQAKTSIGEHIAAVKRLSGEEAYIDSFADPENAEDRAEMRKAGIDNKAARKEVARGVETVQGKLKTKRNGKPSLFIFNTCSNTLRELATYRYPTGTASRDPKDLPLAKNDHCVDVLRYVIYSVQRPVKKGSIYAA